MSDESPGLLNPIADILMAEEGDVDWLVPDMLLQGTMNILAGDSGVGKSYISYKLAMAIATGVQAFSGLVPPSEPRRVVYFDEENSAQDRNKYIKRVYYGLEAMNHDAPDMELLIDNFWPMHFELGTEDWLDRARYIVEQIQPHAIFFDTATPAFAIKDENNNAEATHAMKGIQQLMAVTDPVAAVLILKHAKVVTEKGGRRTIRGAKAWKGTADQLMFQVKSQGRPRRDGLSLTRLEPDKTRAYGLTRTIFITPSYTDDARSGLRLDGSYEPSIEHKKVLRKEEAADDEE